MGRGRKAEYSGRDVLLGSAMSIGTRKSKASVESAEENLEQELPILYQVRKNLDAQLWQSIHVKGTRETNHLTQKGAVAASKRKAFEDGGGKVEVFNTEGSLTKTISVEL